MSNKERTEEFTIGPVVLAFPSLFKPSKPRDSEGEEKFNTAIIVTAEIYAAQIKPQMDALIAANFSASDTASNRFNWGFLPCTYKPATYPPELTTGMWFGNAKSQTKKDVVDRNQMPIMDPNVIRDGAKVYISINLYAFNKAGNVGVGVGLGPVMHIGDGPALNVGGGISAGVAFAGIQIDPSIAPPQAAPPVGMPMAPPAGMPAAPGVAVPQAAPTGMPMAPPAGMPAAPTMAAPTAAPQAQPPGAPTGMPPAPITYPQ